MAASGSYDFTLTRDQLITEALERIGVVRPNQTAKPNDIASAARSLNVKLKARQGDGLELFTYRDAFMFLTREQNEYRLGVGADRAVESYRHAVLTVAGVTGDAQVQVDDATGMTATDIIGVQLDTGDLEWFVIGGILGNVLALIGTLSGAAGVGKSVFTYPLTAPIQRPLRIADPFIRDSSDVDTPVTLFSISEYREMANKIATGRIVNIAYDPQLSTSRLLVWPTPDDTSDVLGFVYKKPVDDFDAAGDSPGYPVDWFEYLVAELVCILGDKFSLPLGERMYFQKKALMARDELLDNEEASVRFVPGR